MTPTRKYKLAELAMRGNSAALAELGNPKTLGELDAIMRDGFEGLSDEERADDLANLEGRTN